MLQVVVELHVEMGCVAGYVVIYYCTTGSYTASCYTMGL